MDFEFGFRSLWGVAAAAFWFWVNGISGRLKDAEKDRIDLRNELHQVKIDYATKADAKADVNGVLAAIERLEAKLDRLSDKLDSKADKQ